MTEDVFPAADVAAAMLHALFSATRSCDAPGLADFQRDAVTRLGAIMDRYGGALLCDSVGLGKTHVAAEIASEVLRDGGTVLVIGPSQLRPQWSRHLRAGGGWTWASHAMLSRRHTVDRLMRRRFDFLVVDEAHGFRNAATRRYHTLARVTLGARLLLITATPVNNSLRDFYNLLRLFAADDAFVGIGVPSLRNALEAAESDRPGELRRIAQHVMVRRTREAVRRWPGGMTGERRAVSSLRFPLSDSTELIAYDLTAVYAGRVDEILDSLASLRFAAYGRVDGGTAGELMRLSLIKRMESSSIAFAASVSRFERLNALFIDAADAGLLFDARRDAHLAAAVDGAMQLSLPQLALPRWPARLDPRPALECARQDAELLGRLVQVSRKIAAVPDAKTLALIRLLREALVDDKVIIFSEYRDTAYAIWRACERLGRVALVHGGEARLGRRRTSRRVVIERFAPLASHTRTPARIEDVRVLIATDVLSEGMNLQDARVVVSYDLPWNPVRLAQRAGRIDRMGSPHDRIRILAFRPDRAVERVLGLMRSVRRKLRAIRIVGGDAPAPFHRPGPSTVQRLHTDARELARVELLRRQPTFSPAPVRAACSWREPIGAVLCCVRLPGTAALVLVRDDGGVTVDTDAAWRALLTALSAGAPTGHAPAADVPFAEAEARAVRVVQRAARNTTRTFGDPVRLRAAGLVRRWLVTRRGTPDPADFERADAALAMLGAPGAAGLDACIRDCLDAGDAERVIRCLLALRSARPSRPDAPPEPPRVVAAIRLVPVDPL